MSLFVNDDEEYRDDNQQRSPGGSPESPLIPVRVQPDTLDSTPIYESREVNCTLPLTFHQDIVNDMLSKDGLLILGHGLGWEIIVSNLAYALSSPSVSLITGDRQQTKKSLVLVIGAKEEEIIKLSEELTDLHWINSVDDENSGEDGETSPLKVIGGEVSSDKRRKIYDNGGCVSITARVLVVDLLSGMLSPADVTGIIALHAERIRETSSESFVINLFRDKNDWGFVKAVSDEPESFTGFTPLATKLKVLTLTNVFLWPRFHVEVSSSLTHKNKFAKHQKQEAENSRFVTEINVRLSYKMNKIQSAVLSCLSSCIQELKRHNPSLVNEYWDMENIHDRDFVQRIRIVLDSHWHRISWTSKQLVHDLATLKDLLRRLLTVDSLSFYQTVQGIVDLNVKTLSTGILHTTSMSPWLTLDEADTIISYAKERALAKVKVTKKNPATTEEQKEGLSMTEEIETEEYLLEELPKWDQLGLLLDDIMFEKSALTTSKNNGPILIMCSSNEVARQLCKLIPRMKKEENSITGKKRFSSRRYMVNRLNDYLEWREISKATSKINNELSSLDEEKADEIQKESLQISKTFSRGKNEPISKRRRTRGASSVANVTKLYSGSVLGKNTEAVELEGDIMEKLNEEDEDDEEEYIDEDLVPHNENNPIVIHDEEPEGSGGFVPDDIREVERVSHVYFEHIDRFDQVIIETFNDKTSDALLQELSPSYIIMYEPDLSFIRRVEIYQAINRESPARTYFMYYGTSVEEQSHLLRIKKEKEAFTKLIREKASLSKSFSTESDNWKYHIRKQEVVNTRIAGGANFRTGDEEIAVIVDAREFSSSLPNLLYRAGIKVLPCMITVGDYILSPKICIERKAIPDLISSFKSGRLYHQCEQMFRHYELPALLIEFDESQSFSFEPFSELRIQKGSAGSPIGAKLMQQEIQSKLVMLLIAFPKLKIIWSSSPYETAQIFLELKANQEDPDVGEAISKGVNTLIESNNDDPPMFNDDAIDLIQNIPGINNVNYFKVIQRVANIEQLVQLTQEQFHDLLGVENGDRAFNFINYSYR